jgi:hypothetical protein
MLWKHSILLLQPFPSLHSVLWAWILTLSSFTTQWESGWLGGHQQTSACPPSRAWCSVLHKCWLDRRIKLNAFEKKDKVSFIGSKRILWAPTVCQTLWRSSEVPGTGACPPEGREREGIINEWMPWYAQMGTGRKKPSVAKGDESERRAVSFSRVAQGQPPRKWCPRKQEWDHGVAPGEEQCLQRLKLETGSLSEEPGAWQQLLLGRWWTGSECHQVSSLQHRMCCQSVGAIPEPRRKQRYQWYIQQFSKQRGKSGVTKRETVFELETQNLKFTQYPVLSNYIKNKFWHVYKIKYS